MKGKEKKGKERKGKERKKRKGKKRKGKESMVHDNTGKHHIDEEKRMLTKI